jgi:uncharacterized protein YggU (UPF0235/DUF167 family)
MQIQSMSIIEWLLVIELVLLVTAGMFRLAGNFVRPEEGEHDPFTVFYMTFWKVFLRHRGKLRSAVSSLDVAKAKQYQEMKFTGDVEGIKQLLSAEFGEHAFDESEISAALDESIAGPAQPTMTPAETANAAAGERPRAGIVNVKIIPFANSNERVSIRRDGFTIQVTCGPEEGQANKTAIDLVAQALQVKPYQITLLKGHYKPLKVVQIAGFDQAELDMKLATHS